jgi:hypothetical protein
MWDRKKNQKVTPVLAGKLFSVYTEAEFLEVIGTKVLRVYLLLFTVTSTNGFYPL